MCENGFPPLYVSAFSLAKDSSFLLNASLNSSSVPLSSCGEEPDSCWFSLMIRLSFTASEILGIKHTPDYRWDSAGGKKYIVNATRWRCRRVITFDQLTARGLTKVPSWRREGHSCCPISSV